MFRNETSVAAQRAEDSWRKRSKLNLRENGEASRSQGLRKASSSATLKDLGRSIAGKVRSSLPSQDETSGTPDVEFEPAAQLQTLAITPAIAPDLCDVAYTRFLYDFVTHGSAKKIPGEPSDGIFTFVPALYERAPPNSILVTITRAVSYINFANRCNSAEAAARGEELFGKGITMLSKAVSDKQKAASDEVLCSTYLMGVYEVRFASPSVIILADLPQNLTILQRRGTFIAHQGGSNALAQLRAIARYFSSPVSASLYEVTYTQMVLASLA